MELISEDNKIVWDNRLIHNIIGRYDAHRLLSNMNNRSDIKYYCSTYSTDENESSLKIDLGVYDVDVEGKTFR